MNASPQSLNQNLDYFWVRLKRLQTQLQPHQALLISKPTDIAYLSGFAFLEPEEREALLIVTVEQVYLLHTTFADLSTVANVSSLIGCTPSHLQKHLTQIQVDHDITEIMIDESTLFTVEYLTLQRVGSLTVTTTQNILVAELRTIKDEIELNALKEAGQIAALAYEQSLPELRVGMTEREFQTILEFAMKKLGSQKPAFPTIVAFGANGALPHHQPTDKVLEDNMAVLIDFGATVKNYRSDMTRTTWFGSQPPAEFIAIKTAVMAAYQAAVAELKPGIPTQKIDQAARETITKAGYGKQFIHTTGHGVGLDIHEAPSLNWNNADPLGENMIVTVEPGIYIPDQFGFRFENTLCITPNGSLELTRL